MRQVIAYTDGACRGNPGPGGWGVILTCDGREKELSGGEAETTNNRMELTAAIEALRALKEPCEVTLVSDSRYLVDAVLKGWLSSWVKKNWRTAGGDAVKNPDLWMELLSLMEVHKVRFEWVRGHKGHPYNERCDKLATAYADTLSPRGAD